MIFNPHPYQETSINFVIDNPISALLLEMGLGKTVSVLTAFNDLKYDFVSLTAMLVIAPLRVTNMVWKQEAEKWAHLKHLKVNRLHGPDRIPLMLEPADVYVINYDGLPWLAKELSQKKGLRFPVKIDMLVLDESTAVKTPSARRSQITKALALGVDRKVILTGTPTPNNVLDIWNQINILDDGERLGNSFTAWRTQNFIKPEGARRYNPLAGVTQRVTEQIADLCLTMKAADYLDMPEKIINKVDVELPEKAREKYVELETEFFTQIDATDILAFNASALSAKLRQVVQGFVYTDEKKSIEVHKAKVNALREVVDGTGSPVLVAIQFRHEAEMLKKEFGNDLPIIYGGTSAAAAETYVQSWNGGTLPLLVAHPACLHPSTELLTKYRGWVKLIDIKLTDQVFDGVEFVSHKGCSYSGHKEVLDVFGITMTPEHKLLIDGRWVEAKDVGNSKDLGEKAVYRYAGDDEYLSEMLPLRGGLRDTTAECAQAQPIKTKALLALHTGYLSSYDGDEDLENLEWYEKPCERSTKQELWGAGYRDVRCVEGLQGFPQGHDRRVPRQLDPRTNKWKQGVLETQLYMGYERATTSQQEDEQDRSVQGNLYSLSGSVQGVGGQQDDVNIPAKQGDERRRGSRECEELDIQRGETPKEAVYDLVDCGPRHRFLIRNNAGEAFISHNSMAHGINLQYGGHTVVWFGLPWNLEHYLQFNARLHRQGQTMPVMIHHLIMRDTIDEAIMRALESKDGTMAGIMENLKVWREENRGSVHRQRPPAS